MSQKKTAGGTTGRYVLRHILRSPGKSLLCLALAAIFMLGLMLIRVSAIRSENELEHLYTTTAVTVEIIRSTSAPIYGADEDLESGFVYHTTVEKLMDTGFIGRRYVEACKENAALIRLNAQGEMVDGGAFSAVGTLYGIEYPQEFLSLRQIEGEITYFEGWDESAFRQTQSDWMRPNETTGLTRRVYPTVISQELYDMLQMEAGDMLRVKFVKVDPLDSQKKTTYSTDLTIAGIHPGDVRALLMPVDAMRRVNGVDLKYDRVTLTIDPSRNRQLDEFRIQASNIISRGGPVPLTALYWDQELRQAIAPMEQVISFMKALYPVTLGLSFIVAAGVAVLLTLMSAKEAAILRILGNSKMRCRVILCLQTTVVCMVGLIIGHLGAVAMAHVMVPDSAASLMLPALGRVGLYLLYTVLGTVGASAVMPAKNPLELLQVKE